MDASFWFGIAGVITALATLITAVLSHKKLMRELALKESDAEMKDSQLIRQQLREELQIAREMIGTLNIKLDHMNLVIDDWQTKYFELKQEHVVTMVKFKEVEKALAGIRTDLQVKFLN